MSAVEIRAHERVWVRPLGDETAAPNARAEQWLPLVAGVLLAAGDALVVIGAFLLAHWVRFVAPSESGAALGIEQYLLQGSVVAGVACLLLMLQGLYDEERVTRGLQRFQAIVSAVSAGLAIALIAPSLSGTDQSFSRIWLATGWALSIVGLAAWRVVADRVYARVRQALVPANRVLIVGANMQAEDIAAELDGRFKVVGCVDNGSDLQPGSHLALLGPIAQIEQLVQHHAIDELVIVLPANRREQITRLIARGFRRRVKVKYLPSLGEIMPHRFEVHELGGRRYIGFASAARVSWIKRGMDLLLTAVGLIVIAPLLLLVAAAIRLDSPGPIFFRQERVGRHGRRFLMLKFRSMRRDADRLLTELREQNEASGPLFKMKDDPRVTRVGRILRRLSIDELPQLFNVLRGDMSLVGPRPPLPSEVDKYEEWQFGRLRAVPGLTGLWQVSGRSDVSFHDMVRLDLHYIRNWSMALDIEILVRTLPAVLSSRGAY